MTIGEEIIPITKQVESMTERMLNITEQLIGMSKNNTSIYVQQETMGYTD